MIQQGKIGPREAMSIITTVISVNALLSGAIAADYALHAGWLAIIVAGGLAALGTLFSARLMAHYPDKGLIGVGQEVLGPTGGFCIGLLYFNLFLLASALFLRLEADRIALVYLPDTPAPVIALFMTLAGLGVAYLGLEALGRMSLVFSSVVIGGLLLPLFLSANFWNWNNLFPLLGTGISDILKGGLSLHGLFSEIIILAVFYSSIKVSSSPMSFWYQPLLIGLLVNVIAALITLLVFSVPAITENIFPVVQTSRLIYLGRFFQRIDAFFAFFWMIAICLKFIILFFTSNVILAELLKLPYYKPFIVPLGIIVFSLAFLPSDLNQATHLATHMAWRWSGIIAFLLPAVMLIICQLKQPKKQTKQSGKGKGKQDE
jgi:spore germination protein KB